MFKALDDWNDHLYRISELEKLFPKRYPPLHKVMSPSSDVYIPRSRPRSLYDNPLRALGYNSAGQPIHQRPTPPRPLRELFEPNTHVPISRFTRDPWWWDYPELRPHELPVTYKSSPFYLRNSYLSPVKRTYLWGNGGHHPIRPLSPHYY